MSNLFETQHRYSVGTQESLYKHKNQPDHQEARSHFLDLQTFYSRFTSFGGQ